MAERMTVRQFLALGPNEQPSVMAAEALWNDIGRLETELAEAKAEAAPLRSALQMWDDFDNIPGREFDEKYPWLAGTDYDFQERLMYALTQAALDALKGAE